MKPSLPKGTRDFSSKEVAQRNYLKKVLQEAFGLTKAESFEVFTAWTKQFTEE